MNKKELISKLNELEWEDFEVKAAKAEIPKDSWETVSSFSNTTGGWLVFGVKQIGKKFEIQGLTNAEKIEQDFLNVLNGKKFNARINTKQQKYSIDDKIVLAFYIPISDKKPIYYNNPSNTFIRRGSSDHRATKEEIDSMFRDQTFGTKTSQIAPKTSFSDLKLNSLNQYRDYMSRFNPDVSYNQLNITEILTKLRVIDDGACTYSGLLMFGKRSIIEKHFPDFWVDLMEIPGTSYSDAKIRYTYRLDEFDNLWEYYFACFGRLKQKIDVEFILSDEGFGKDISPGIVAIREALVNMLMHADYFSPAHSRIRIFTNHIEFFNAGGLPKPFDELKGKDMSLPRNPIITKLFRMVKLAENAGFGFDKIETNWKKYNNTLPVYDLSFDSTIIKFDLNVSKDITKPITKNGDNIFRSIFGVNDAEFRSIFGLSSDDFQSIFSSKHIKVLELINNNPNITALELAEIMGVTARTIENYTSKLRKNGILKRLGSDKTGQYIILKRK